MPGYLDTLVFGYYPYIAMTVFVLGSIVRFDREQYTWRSGSSQMLRKRQLVLGSNLFHIGILIIFLGHLVGLLTPAPVFHALGISLATKQMMAIVIGGAAGLACLAGIGLLTHRRLFDPRIRKTSAPADTAILLLILAQLLLGLISIPISLGNLDGSEMVKLMSWAQRIVTFRSGAVDFVVDVNPVFKLHLFLGMTLFLLTPFTRLVHVLSAPVWYLGRRGYQIVRTRSSRA